MVIFSTNKKNTEEIWKKKNDCEPESPNEFCDVGHYQPITV